MGVLFVYIYYELKKFTDSLDYLNMILSEDDVYIFNEVIVEIPINIPREIFSDNENAYCIICMEPILKKNIVSKLQCGHIYHYDCLNKWVKKKKNCPVCRTKL